MTTSDAPIGLFESLGPGDVREAFTVTPSAGGGFGAIAVAVARKLAVLVTQPGQHNVTLEVSPPDENRYVQCIVDQVDGIWIEAVSNTFLAAEAQLDAERQAVLVDELGFAPPGGESGPNYSQHVEAPVDWGRIGLLLVTTLCEVYGAGSHDELTLTIYPHEHL